VKEQGSVERGVDSTLYKLTSGIKLAELYAKIVHERSRAQSENAVFLLREAYYGV